MKTPSVVVTLLLAGICLVAGYFLGDYFGFGATVVTPTEHGRFLSEPVVRLLENRDLELMEDFVYVDPENTAWLAPIGSKVNGASIPRIFWSWVGSPLTGKYRNASIVHDVECDLQKRPWEEVHRMFYHGCLAGDVEESEAKKLYWAVERFGPRWQRETRARTVIATGQDGNPVQIQQNYSVSVPVQTRTPTAEDLEWAEAYFRENNPSLIDIPLLGLPNEEDAEGDSPNDPVNQPPIPDPPDE